MSFSRRAANASSEVVGESPSSSYSSGSADAPQEDIGTLASDEALAALREKLTGGAL